jgi:hypothetical protein
LGVLDDLNAVKFSPSTLYVLLLPIFVPASILLFFFFFLCEQEYHDQAVQQLEPFLLATEFPGRVHVEFAVHRGEE